MPVVPMNPLSPPLLGRTPITPQIPLQDEEHPLVLITEIPDATPTVAPETSASVRAKRR
jgi:hypothetical protein